MTRKGLYTLSAIIFVVLMGFITLPPITSLIDRVNPHILGFPFMQFWLLFIPVLLAAWLIVWFCWEARIQDREAAKEVKEEVEK